METFSAFLAIVSGIHRSPVDSPHKGQWHGAWDLFLSNDWMIEDITVIWLVYIASGIHIALSETVHNIRMLSKEARIYIYDRIVVFVVGFIQQHGFITIDCLLSIVFQTPIHRVWRLFDQSLLFVRETFYLFSIICDNRKWVMWFRIFGATSCYWSAIYYYNSSIFSMVV